MKKHSLHSNEKAAKKAKEWKKERNLSFIHRPKVAIDAGRIQKRSFVNGNFRVVFEILGSYIRCYL